MGLVRLEVQRMALLVMLDRLSLHRLGSRCGGLGAGGCEALRQTFTSKNEDKVAWSD